MIGVYALSRNAFIRFIEQALTNEEICSTNGNDDIEMSNCLKRINVVNIDGIDHEGKGLFFRDKPENFLFPEKGNVEDKWYWHKLRQGIDNCCSNRLIVLQGFYNTEFLYLEYFIYKVRLFGKHRVQEELPEKVKLERVFTNNLL